MRDDIKNLIETSTRWRLMTDPVLRDLKAAREIADNEGDYNTVEIIDDMIKVQREVVLR
jgi:DNA-binding ferritin-like protein